MLANAGLFRWIANGTRGGFSEAASTDGTVSRGGRYSYSDHSGLFGNRGCIAGILRFHYLRIRRSQRLSTDILPQFAAYTSSGVLLLGIWCWIPSTAPGRVHLRSLR